MGSLNADHKQPLTTLRHEAGSVHDEGIYRVAQTIQAQHGLVKIFAAVRGEKPDNILKKHKGRTPVAEAGQQVREAPQRPGVQTGQSFAPARE